MSRAREYESWEIWAADHPDEAKAMREEIIQSNPQGINVRSLDRRMGEKFGELVIAEMIEDGDAYRSPMGAIFLTEQGKRKGVDR